MTTSRQAGATGIVIHFDTVGNTDCPAIRGLILQFGCCHTLGSNVLLVNFAQEKYDVYIIPLSLCCPEKRQCIVVLAFDTLLVLGEPSIARVFPGFYLREPPGPALQSIISSYIPAIDISPIVSPDT